MTGGARAGTAHRTGPCARRRRTARAGRTGRWRGRDRGQAAVEYLGFLPVLLAVALAVVQLGLAAYTVQQAGTAARAAARADGFDRAGLSPQAAGRAAVSGWLDTRVTGGTSGPHEVTWTAEIKIPSIVPGVGFGSAKKSATMPRE